jgi:hypothetical protein
MTTKTTAAAVFAALWTQPKYLRLHARKDVALRAVTLAEFYRASDAERAKLDAAAKRALRALQKYEDAALAAR